MAATGVTVTPPNTINATTGAHAAGLVDVVVTNPDTQSGTLANGYTYVAPPPPPSVTSISPTSGTTAGGTPVTITGNNFQTGATVSLGGVAATGVTVTPPNTINATTGAHAAGLVNVVVTNPDSQSGTLTNGYTYVAPPTITSFSPTSGSAGKKVTINGTNFTGTTSVTFNFTSASFTVNSSIKITATVPAGATTGRIRVTTPGGTATSATDFTVRGAAMPAGPWEIRYAGIDRAGNAPRQLPVRADLAEKLGPAIGAEVDSGAAGMSDPGLSQSAVKQERLPVETVASLAFPFTGSPDPGLTLRHIRPFDDDGAGSAGTAVPALAASVGVKPQAVSTLGRRYSFYSPEMNLLAETELKTTAGAPAVLYEYIWFNGHPVAQVDAGTTTHWTFTDHLGTPLIQMDSSGAVYWQAEHEPYGRVFALRTADQHQPLRLPGQEAEQLNLGPNGATERSYNIFRWYRPGWGRYNNPDPLGLVGSPALYGFSDANPLAGADPLGLFVVKGCGGSEGFIRNVVNSVLNTIASCVGCPNPIGNKLAAALGATTIKCVSNSTMMPSACAQSTPGVGPIEIPKSVVAGALFHGGLAQPLPYFRQTGLFCSCLPALIIHEVSHVALDARSETLPSQIERKCYGSCSVAPNPFPIQPGRQ